MPKIKQIKSPTQIELIEPVFAALRNLGGSATITEIRDKVIEMLRLPDEIVDEPHKGNDQRTELEYQLAWARTRLKAFGAITNSQRGVWMITPEYMDKTTISKADVVDFLKKQRISNKSPNETITSPEDDNTTDEADEADEADDNVDIPEELEPWRTELAETLHSINPYAFERLSMLLLRECGFSKVFVTKKSGDGGIDGTGKFLINGIFSFNIAFQCKRFVGSVSAGAIRDFRGSLTTDIEKGVFITTGTFTKAAREEASKAGKQQIDLIDGEEFINKLIEYRIGVHEKTVYEVDRLFFEKV